MEPEPPDRDWASLALPGPGPGRIARLRRRLGRLRNELRSVLEERGKRGSLKAWPVTLYLYHTTVCNLRCVFCEQAFGVPQLLMRPEVYARIRDELFEHVSELALTVMGEPLCAPSAFVGQLLDDAERFDLRLEMTTNATLLGPDEQLRRFLRRAHRINVSVDGATAATYEALRPPAKWCKLTENLDRMARLRRELPVWRRPMMVFNYVLMRQNLDELPAFVDLAAGWNAHAVHVMPLLEVDPSLRGELIDPAEEGVRATLDRAMERALARGVQLRVHGVELSPPPPRSVRERARRAWYRLMSSLRPTGAQGPYNLMQKVGHRFRVAKRECPFLWSKAYALLDGKVCTCCKHPGAFVTGDLMEEDFGGIWNGEQYRRLRETLNTDEVAPACRDCYLLR